MNWNKIGASALVLTLAAPAVALAKGHDQSEGQGETVEATVTAAQGLGEAVGTQYGFSNATPAAEVRQNGPQ